MILKRIRQIIHIGLQKSIGSVNCIVIGKCLDAVVKRNVTTEHWSYGNLYSVDLSRSTTLSPEKHRGLRVKLMNLGRV